MNRCCIIPFLVLTALSAAGQKNNGVNLTLGAGASYFFTDKTISQRVNDAGNIGVNYTLHNKHQTLMFCPALHVQFNRYRARIRENQLVHVSQDLIGLDLDILMRLSKKSLLRMGLYFNGLANSSVFVSSTYYNGRGYYGYGNDELNKGYSATILQAGFTVGLSFPFKLFKRENKFNIKLVQTVSSVVNSGYMLSESLVGRDINVLSTRSKPTALMLGFDFSLKKGKKKKKTDEEEEE